MERRAFLKSAAAATAGMAAQKLLPGASADVGSANAARLPQRPYGKTGLTLSTIGFGGIVVMNAEQEHANRLVAEMVERGINYFDVAPSYGNAEARLGPALKPYRERSFLACKTTERTAEGAARELDASLQRMQTDYFDLYQLHAITGVEKDVDAAFAKGGAMETIIQAHKDGRVRYIGFSAHSDEAALAAMDRFDFTSALYPISFAMHFKGKFDQQVIARAQERGMSLLALKMLARQRWQGSKNDPLRKKYPKCWYEPVRDPAEAEMALRWTLSQPITAAIPPGDESLFRMAVDLAMRFEPITETQTAQLRTLSGDLAPLFSA